MASLSDLRNPNNNLAGAKEFILSLYQAAGGSARGWFLGWPTFSWIDLSARASFALDNMITQGARGMFFDSTTDPGDPGDLSADQTPRAGFASAFGSGWWGTERREKLFAEGVVTLTAGPAGSTTFTAADITVQRATPDATDGGLPTYRGVGSAPITLAPFASVDIDIIADVIGEYSNALAADISICQTQSFLALACTNANAVLGSEREPLADYIDRCAGAGDQQSPGGPQRAYKRAANTAKDGTPLQRHDGSGVVGITKVYVSPENASNEVTVYYAGPSGGAALSSVDIETANGNITGEPVGDLVDPIGVLPDTVTLLPLDPGGNAASDVNVDITYTAEIDTFPGIDTGAIEDTIGAALAAWFEGSRNPIGGTDQTAGAGVLRPNDLLIVIGSAYPGLRNVVVSAPSSTVPIGLGEVGVLGSIVPTVTAI